MEFPRLPRFRRVSSVPSFEITRRDLEILRLVYDHRFLRSSHLCALISGSSQQILRRLKLLYHHGFLERPRAQLLYYHRGGSRTIAYGIANQGVNVLGEKRGRQSKRNWNEKNQSVGTIYLEHELFVSDVMVALELASRQAGIRLLTARDLVLDSRPFRWRVSLTDTMKLGIIPDRVFALECPAQKGGTERRHFILEADRGTMPVVRKDLAQTSIWRKLLTYEATWAQGVLEKRFGFSRFRVLVVSLNALRRDATIEACAQLKSGHGLFLFADRSILERPADILNALWCTSRMGETARLMD